MPLKIQNYGEWAGDKRGGHHPPACTCFNCNERKRSRPRSVASPRRPLGRPAPRVAVEPIRPRTSGFGMFRHVVATAIRYTVALHAVGLAGLVVYGLTQGGTSDVGPVLSSAGDAYIQAWLILA